MDKPFIVVTTGLLDVMKYEEQRFVIGHEMGHALSGHAVYRTILLHLMRLAGTIGWVPIGGWALRAIIAGTDGVANANRSSRGIERVCCAARTSIPRCGSR